MTRISPRLFRRIVVRTGLSERRVYKLIEDKVRETSLPPYLAAIALASDLRINISRYATELQLAEIRSSRTARSPPPIATSRPSTIPVVSVRSPAVRDKSREGGTAPDAVFVVHGRRQRVRMDFFSLLRSLGLRPLEWQRAIELTKKPTPYVGEILDAAFSKARAVIVLMTPDDEARLRQELVRSNDPDWEKELQGQPRPNVLFEAGMAFGSHPDSTVLVQIGSIRPISDIAGRHLVHLTGSTESRKELVAKLRACHCRVDDSGNDWLRIGEFSSL